MIQGSTSTVHLLIESGFERFYPKCSTICYCYRRVSFLCSMSTNLDTIKLNCTKMQRLAAFDALCLEFVELRPIEFPFILHHQFSQWSFLVLLKGGIGSIVSTIWEYWHFIPIVKRLENPYHLLSEASAPMRRIFLPETCRSGILFAMEELRLDGEKVKSC